MYARLLIYIGIFYNALKMEKKYNGKSLNWRNSTVFGIPNFSEQLRPNACAQSKKKIICALFRILEQCVFFDMIQDLCL